MPLSIASGVALLFGSVRTEYLKSQQMELSDEVRKKIEEEGIYHITTKECAEKIVESGYLLPSKGVLDNHFSKSRYGNGFADFAYMFAGKPTAELFKVNLSHRAMPDGTIYAVKHKPNKFDIENYTERLEDGAITHEGILDLSNSQPELVRMKMEKGKLVEIPWDEPTKPSFMQAVKDQTVVRFCRGLPSAFREISRNVVFRDKDKKLARSIAIRKDQRKMLEQYDNDGENREFIIEQDGEEYTVKFAGAKVNDGKILNGFAVSKNGVEGYAKNLFTDGFNVSEMSQEEMTEFFKAHAGFEAEHSEYIGKPVRENGEIRQEIDEEYKHHFNYKQLRIAENHPVYAKYVAEQEAKKVSQFKKLGTWFKEISSRKRAEAMEILSFAKEMGLHPEELTQEVTKESPDYGMVL